MLAATIGEFLSAMGWGALGGLIWVAIYMAWTS